MNIHIAYFSGTGSTEYVAEQFRSVLEGKGQSVRMTRIGKGNPQKDEREDLLILIYAVYAGNPPGPVVRWLRERHHAEGIPASVISVSGGGEVTPNLACRVWAKRILRRRSYSLFHEGMIVMPSNWIVATKPILTDSLLDLLPEKIESLCTEILGGTVNLKRADPLNRFISLLSRFELRAARSFGRNIRVGESCNGCGVCARNCPVGNILMEEKRPRFGDLCTLCLNCLYGCPRKALTPGKGKKFLIPQGYDFETLLANHRPAPEFDLEAETKGFLWLGVRRYLRKSP